MPEHITVNQITRNFDELIFSQLGLWVVKRQRSSRFGRPLARAITPFGLCAGEKCGLPAGLLGPDFCILPSLSLYPSDKFQCYTVK
jgi:hypothetical protein